MADDDSPIDLGPVTESGGDSVVEETSKSWLQRIGESVMGVVIGFALVIGSCVLLFWNEGRAVKEARSLAEGAGLVVSVAADRVDPANEGKLVHIAGDLTAGGPAVDPEFGIRSAGVRLQRSVEMMQWIEETESETKKELGGSERTRTTYKYSKAWRDHPIDSSRFKERSGHLNPPMTYRTRGSLAPGIKLGAFAVPDGLLGNFGSTRPVSIPEDSVASMRAKFNRPVRAADGTLYVGVESATPAVGDYKIAFAEVPLQAASIVARQAGVGLGPFQAKAGGTVELIAAGRVPAADMFKQAQDANRIITWILRAVGAVLMFIGFALILGPLSVLASVIPILGDVVGAGAGLVGLLLTAAVAPLVIAVAWFFYRPLVSLIVLVVGGALTYGAIWLVRQRRAQKAAAKPAAA